MIDCLYLLPAVVFSTIVSKIKLNKCSPGRGLSPTSYSNDKSDFSITSHFLSFLLSFGIVKLPILCFKEFSLYATIEPSEEELKRQKKSRVGGKHKPPVYSIQTQLEKLPTCLKLNLGWQDAICLTASVAIPSEEERILLGISKRQDFHTVDGTRVQEESFL